MKKSKMIEVFTTLLEQNRKRRISSDFLALILIDTAIKHGMVPPYSEEKAKEAKPKGYEWDNE